MVEDAHTMSRKGGWDAEHLRYVCADRRVVAVPRQGGVARLEALLADGGVAYYSEYVGRDGDMVALFGPWSGLFCRASRPRPRIRLVAVSGVFFSRGMAEVVGNRDQPATFASPRTARALGRDVFWECKALRRVRLNEGLEVLGAQCLSETELSQISVPASVREISDYTFNGCWRLARVAFAPGSRLEKIGAQAFSHSAIASFAAPPALREVVPGAFCDCGRLRMVTLNEGLEVLGADTDGVVWLYGAFEDSGLEAVRLPASLRALGPRVFCGCARLAAAELPAGLTVIGERCFQDSGLEEIIIPAGVREIGVEAFRGCERLERVAFAKGSRLERIKSKAFACMQLREITFPAGAEVASDAVGAGVSGEDVILNGK